jgi:hypothetical protein
LTLIIVAGLPSAVVQSEDGRDGNHRNTLNVSPAALFGAWIYIGRFRIAGCTKETTSPKLAHIGGFG